MGDGRQKLNQEINETISSLPTDSIIKMQRNAWKYTCLLDDQGIIYLNGSFHGKIWKKNWKRV